MRSVGLVAVLLLFVACKPVARAPVSELEAVTDGNLTLGMVAAESSNGAQAYRLLLCRKSASYPQWMLNDNNRCRPALLDHADNEVVFIHDELERDFATKYTGYGKGFVVPALIGIGAVGALFGGGRWLLKHTPDKLAKPVTDVSGNVRKAILENNISKKITAAPGTAVASLRKLSATYTPNWLAVPNARYSTLYAENQAGKWSRLHKRGILNVESALKEQRGINGFSHRLHQLEHENKLLKAYDKAKDKNKFLAGLGEVDDDFIEKTNAMHYKWGDTNKPMPAPAYWNRLAKSNKMQNIKDLRVKAADPGFNPQTRIAELEGDPQANIVHMVQTKRFTNAKNIADAKAALVRSRTIRQYTPWGMSREGFRSLTLQGAAAGAAGIALVTLTDLDKSVFGYDDRQASVHWNQVFSESMRSEKQVKDLPGLLETFADFFGHKVNQQALALGS